MPYRDPHTAAPCLWAVLQQMGGQFEVSGVVPEKAKDAWWRKGKEAACITMHRRQARRTSTANLGQMVPGYEQSSYRKDGNRGGKLESQPDSLPSLGRGPLPSRKKDDPRHGGWMGLDWSSPILLNAVRDTDLPRQGLYRLWRRKSEARLFYIGESRSLRQRLYSHARKISEEVVVSVAAPASARKRLPRKEIEVDLIGTHHLVVGGPPTVQFGGGS